MTTVREIKAKCYFVDSWDSAVRNSMDWFWKHHHDNGGGVEELPILLRYVKHFGCDPVWVDSTDLPPDLFYAYEISDDFVVCDYKDSDDVYLVGIVFKSDQDRMQFLLRWA